MSLSLHPEESPSPSLSSSLDKTIELFFTLQSEEGYWCFTLEANETIGSGFIQLTHFLKDVDPVTQAGLALRMLSQQKEDGSWSLFYGGPGDISITVECYFALRLAGYPATAEPLQKAKGFILSHGGLTKIRIFSRIHLALFGLVPWSACPSLPIWFVLFPSWLGVSIYEFSSWARASIVPLLLLGDKKPVRKINIHLEELYCELEGHRCFAFPKSKTIFSLQNFFIQFDKILKTLEKLPWHPGKKKALAKAEQWTREHIEQTEDIYPAMAYAVLGLSALGYPNSDPTIQKALNGLKRFQEIQNSKVHQQCCISPNWDTPWAGVALIEAGVDPKDPRLLKAAWYMISKEIKDFKGDWKFKNPKAAAGGWSFEFQNDYFPDVDDTIEALFFLKGVSLPPHEKEGPIKRGLDWLLSMQSDNGGWGAFDKNNVSEWVNKIPFSDHGACLDSPTPDITGRMLELLSLLEYKKDHPIVSKALRFLWQSHEPDGSWRGRWGVNYIYGTWCVVQGLVAIKEDIGSLHKSVVWLESIQNKDGGWGESCLSDTENRYVPLGFSVPSQTAWALMALIAAGKKEVLSVRRGMNWLMDHQKEDGSWEEPYYTGTGFPGHFYLRYHGYRYYFPLLALSRLKGK